MDERDVARCLQTAELWRLPPGPSMSGSGAGGVARPAPAAAGDDADRPDGWPGEPVLVAGWEDGATFCTAVCSTDIGLAFCRRCPAELASRAIRKRRIQSGPCPAGVTMLAFPAPAGARDQVAVLRIAPPPPRSAGRVSDRVRVSPATLRRAARDADRPDGATILAAARILRSPDSLFAWMVGQRNRGADRRRTATAALAQMIATSEEFHVLYRASQRQRAELERNQRRLERLAREALRTQDVERARIAHQIHDTAAQSMVSAYRFLDAARTSARDGGRADATGGNLDIATERVQAAIGEVRAVLASLLPPGLEELGVAHAIRRRLAELTAGTGIEGHVSGDLPRLEGWVEQALYGMAVEAMSNAVRHAAPATVRVELATSRSRAIVTIRDDGSGFDAAATVPEGDARDRGEGLGLLGMSRQASWLGGRASVRSAPGAGTAIRISIPFERYRLSSDQPGGTTATTAETAGATRTAGPSGGTDPAPGAS